MASPRVPNDDLLNAGLDLMRQDGKPLTRVDSFGRSMMYKLPDGKSVRVRTCNDHILIVLADEDSKGAKLNIEGTDYLLVVMPEVERTPGKVNAYLIPTTVAVEASRSSHQAWKESNPNTKGDNKTWNLWFRRGAKNDYSTKWAEYQLDGEAYTDAVTSSQPAPAGGAGGSGRGAIAANAGGDGSFKAIVEMARQMVSKAAGVSPDAVRITIQFGV
jgi:hypothetical protein